MSAKQAEQARLEVLDQGAFFSQETLFFKPPKLL